MEAQERIAQARSRAGVTDAVIAEALTASEPAAPEALQDEELYLGMLARCVEALGGHLDVAAVFPEETIELPRGPDPFKKH
jgi:hypothetical protein